jgi:hypothetical protein
MLQAAGEDPFDGSGEPGDQPPLSEFMAVLVTASDMVFVVPIQATAALLRCAAAHHSAFGM